MVNSVVICGSRDISPEDLVMRRLKWAIEKLIRLNPNVTFNIGDASGVDYKAQQILNDMGYEDVVVWHVKDGLRNLVNTHWKTVSVDYQEHRKRYTTRDIEMLNNSDYLLAVWDGNSKGTQRNIKSFTGEKDILRTGIEISSKSVGIGGALSLRDDLAKNRKLINKDYPVTANYELIEENCQKSSKTFSSVYQLYRSMEVLVNVVDIEDQMCYGKIPESNYLWLIYCLKSKFLSNAYLLEAVKQRGGYDWLNTCSYTVEAEDFAAIEENIRKHDELGSEASFTDDPEMHNDVRLSEIMGDTMNYKYLTGIGNNSLFIHCLAEAYQQVIDIHES